MTKNQTIEVASWVKKLSTVQLPVLGGVMQELNAVTRSSDSCATQLSEIILRDAALTGKVLRIANSAYHNPNSQNEISTISRAVVQLGFTGIKAISLSVMLVDSLLKQDNKARMLQWMGRGFHTAVQSQQLIEQLGGEDSEEVFITGLMLHLGDMAIWSSKGAEIEALNAELAQGESETPELETQILGTPIKAISIALAAEWNLGPDLAEALEPGHKPSHKAQAVLLGERIAIAAEKGWDSEAFTDVLVDAALFTGRSLQDVRSMIVSGAEKAAKVALNYGANKAVPYIPSANSQPSAKLENLSTMQPNAKLQLDVLRELAELVERQADLNTLFNTVMEGIHRGIGLERVALCLIDPRTNMIQAKYVLGDHQADDWRQDLRFPVKNEQDNLFAYCLHRRQNVWMQRKTSCGLEYLINKKMQNNIDVFNCLVAGIFAGDRPIGILLADRGIKGNAITVDQYESFCHFAQQTNTSLALLAAKKAR